MAATSTKVQSSMLLQFKTGKNANGKDIIKSQKFSKIKVSASDDDILAVGNAIGGLLEYPVNAVLRQDESTILNG